MFHIYIKSHARFVVAVIIQNFFSHLIYMCVLRKVGDRHLVVNLKAGKQSHLICSFILAFGESIPMITRNADVIARFHMNLIVALWLMVEHGDDIVRILTAIVVDVIE